MKGLQEIHELLRGKRCVRKIPGVWIGAGKEVERDVCSLLRNCIRTMLSSDEKLPEGKTIRGSLYAMLPRTLTAREDEGGFHSGSLLMAMLYLPQLRKMGVEVLYLLPIFQYSGQYKKGELGSPYAMRDLYQVDEGLHDELLGDYTPQLMMLQLKAFVEAAHALGMRVMLDVVFRTVARDNVLIQEHPEWFYWKSVDKTAVMPTGGLPSMTLLSDENLRRLYEDDAMQPYLAQFVESPIADDRWLATASLGLKAVEDTYGITTMPAFSDVINDIQPLWSDVTYLRYDLAVSSIAEEYAGNSLPPYIMYDSIKLDRYPPQKPNEQLWEYIVNVLPYYIETFDIDGARIDMGHALPAKLNERIISAARVLKKDFILWSEMLSTEHSAQAKKEGFDFISGATWGDYRLPPQEMTENLVRTLFESSLPVAASLETPDTERIASFFPEDKVKMLHALNLLLPNTIPMFTNGFEVLEKQPMNLGLCKSEDARFALDPQDPFYGKLPFFDAYRFHWENEAIHSWIAYYGGLRERCYELLNWADMTLEYQDGVLGICYKRDKSCLFVLCNLTEENKTGHFFDVQSKKLLTGLQQPQRPFSYKLKPFEIFTFFAEEELRKTEENCPNA